ncbi:Txe/YoeB family addiction module toxin [Pseudopedobacter beijingensis]|uniref:Putative mRNA interferase YoeB n=1 Tax=Pseudopedobacter beijingensis TaxID=1207056 RepID=A0ABW4IG52_9SPHI
MGKYFVEVSKEAKKHLAYHHKMGNTTILREIEQIFVELSEIPYIGTSQPELLKYNYSGYWSRRINRKGQIIYKVVEEKVIVTIVSAKGHYDKK